MAQRRGEYCGHGGGRLLSSGASAAHFYWGGGFAYKSKETPPPLTAAHLGRPTHRPWLAPGTWRSSRTEFGLAVLCRLLAVRWPTEYVQALTGRHSSSPPPSAPPPPPLQTTTVASCQPPPPPPYSVSLDVHITHLPCSLHQPAPQPNASLARGSSPRLVAPGSDCAAFGIPAHQESAEGSGDAPGPGVRCRSMRACQST